MKKSQDQPADALRAAGPPGRSAAELRRRARERLSEKQKSQRSEAGDQGTAEDTARLVHELQVHQIELEMQNEELQQARAQVEALSAEELRQAHTEVRTLMARYIDLFDFAPTGYLTLDREGAIRQVNLNGARLLGVERSRLLKQRFGLFVAEGDRRAFSDFLEKVFASEANECCEVTLPQEGHHLLFVRIEGTRSADGQECRAAVLDLTERKRAAEALREQAELLDMAQVLVCDMDGCILLWNTGAMNFYGFTKQEAVGRVAQELLQTQYPESLAQIEDALRRTDRWEGELVHSRRDGSRVTVSSLWLLHRDPQGRPSRIIEVNNDITERKRAEEALRKLSLQFSRAQDKERRRIARELHDSTGQKLAALSMTVGLLQDATGAPAGKTEKMFADCLAMIEQCAQEIRTLSYLLHPPLLDELGLAVAIGDYVEGFSKRSGVRVALDAPPGLERLPDVVELALFRVVQESLGNIHSHARASTARICLARDAEQVTLEVSDQGRGMSAEMIRALEAGRGSAGVGIAGMRERLRLLGGRLEIESGGQGTTVRAIIPRREEPT
jgi:PAS domain S-box-containing protein